MEKVKAPRPTPRLVKVAPTEAQIEVRRSLRWQQANTAAQEFIAAANDAYASLMEFRPVTPEYVDWLKEAISYVDEYINGLDRLETNYAADEFLNWLKSDAKFFEDFLCSIIPYDDGILDFEHPEIQEGLRNTISEVIEDKMEVVERTGWNMYYVFLGIA